MCLPGVPDGNIASAGCHCPGPPTVATSLPVGPFHAAPGSILISYLSICSNTLSQFVPHFTAVLFKVDIKL